MNNVKRYDPEDWGGLHMAPSVDGNYVLFSDYQKLQDEYNALLEATTPTRLSQKDFCKMLDRIYSPPVLNEPLKRILRNRVEKRDD